MSRDPLKNLVSVYIFRMVKRKKLCMWYNIYIISIAWQISPKVGMVRSRDLILQSNVKVSNKTANINVKNLSV